MVGHGFSLNQMGVSQYLQSFYFLNLCYAYCHFDQVLTFASAASLQHIDATGIPCLF